MEKTVVRSVFLSAAAVSLVSGMVPMVEADPLAASFSYQGYLQQAALPADGVFDFRFEAYDAISAGGQIGATLIHEDIAVTNGLFHLDLLFGNEVLVDKALWLEIAVRDGAGMGTGGFTVLSPRQTFLQFSRNGKEASLSTPLTGTVTMTAFNPTIIGSGTLFTQEMSVNDSLLVEGEIFTVTSILDDSQLEVSPSPTTSALTVVGFRDDALLRVPAGDGQNKLAVDRAGVSIGNLGTPVGRLEYGTIGDCSIAASTGLSGSVSFVSPFNLPPAIQLTPKVGSVGCTSVRLSAVSETGFSWVGTVGGALAFCDCIFWLALGS